MGTAARMSDDFVPEPDVIEQQRGLAPEDQEENEPDLDPDVPEADALEQAHRLPEEEEGR